MPKQGRRLLHMRTNRFRGLITGGVEALGRHRLRIWACSVSDGVELAERGDERRTDENEDKIEEDHDGDADNRTHHLRPRRAGGSDLPAWQRADHLEGAGGDDRGGLSVYRGRFAAWWRSRLPAYSSGTGVDRCA